MQENKKTTENIRNFCIIAHIDHGKSTLADRLLELTNTVEERKMKNQVLDQMELERERGITIKMQPVKMIYLINHFNRGLTQKKTQKNAEKLLYSDLTYKIRGILFNVRKKIGLGHKEQVYHNALEIEFKNAGLRFESKKNIPILYNNKKIGMYQPDFLVEDKVMIELKALPEIGRTQREQIWSYLKGCEYKLALLVNFGSRDLEIKRIVYDTAREFSASSALSLRDSAGVEDKIENYILNLIDTPGHIDFSYEVSRSLKAVEGAVLLVDATQGVQAQTISNLEIARSLDLVIVPVINKIDSPLARTDEVKKEIVEILNCKEEDVLEVSAKTSEGVEKLLEEVISRVPSPRRSQALTQNLKALVFDFEYSSHKGIILYVRIMGGSIKKGDKVFLFQTGKDFIASEVGIFTPSPKSKNSLENGEIGYIITSLKETNIASVGDTLFSFSEKNNPDLLPLKGYKTPSPVVWASIYPESQDDFMSLRQSLERLSLADSSLSFEEEESGILGRGFRCGFLGMLHLEIVAERLKREFNLDLIVATPSVVYKIEDQNGNEKEIYSAALFPESHQIKKIFEPWVDIKIMTPFEKMNDVMQVLKRHKAIIGDTEDFGSDRIVIKNQMPLREMMNNFFEDLKSATSGYASLSYEIIDERPGDLVCLKVLLNDEVIPAFSKIVERGDIQREAKNLAEKLKKFLPKALFVIKIQVKALGRILAAQRISALKKDVTGHLYGGDISRKQKLWKKQKKGKEKLKKHGKVNIPHSVFINMIKNRD